MKAIACHELMDPPRCGWRTCWSHVPTRPSTDTSAGLWVNFADSLITRGQYQVQPKPPFSPGFEVAARPELGAGVEGLAVGDRVIAMTPHGGYAEQVVASASRCVAAMPAAMPDAWRGISGGVRHRMWRCGIGRACKPARRWWCMAPAVGGIDSGGHRQAAGRRSSPPPAVLKTGGGGRTRSGPFDRCRPRGRAGADQGADRWPWRGCGVRSGRRRVVHRPLRSIAFEGRILVIGFAGGTVPQIPANHLLVKNVDVIGLTWPAYAELNPRVMTESFRILLQWYLEGALQPYVSAIYALDRATDALDRVVARKSTGKVVISVD